MKHNLNWVNPFETQSNRCTCLACNDLHLSVSAITVHLRCINVSLLRDIQTNLYAVNSIAVEGKWEITVIVLMITQCDFLLLLTENKSS